MAGPQLAPFYLQRCPLHSCQVDRIEKCPSTKSAACGLRNPYPVSVWCNSVTPCIYSVYIYRVFKNSTDKFRRVVGEVYGSARKIVPVVGVASRGSYGASKASAYRLVSRETVWHACRMRSLLPG